MGGDIQSSIAESELPLCQAGSWKRVIRASVHFPQASTLALVTSAAAVVVDVPKMMAGGDVNLREVTGPSSTSGYGRLPIELESKLSELLRPTAAVLT